MLVLYSFGYILSRSIVINIRWLGRGKTDMFENVDARTISLCNDE